MYKINPPKIHLSTVLGYDVEGKRYIVKDEKIFDTERELVCFLARYNRPVCNFEGEPIAGRYNNKYMDNQALNGLMRKDLYDSTYDEIMYTMYHYPISRLHYKSINGEREVPGQQKVVRGSNIPVLTSHVGQNPRSKSGYEPERRVINDEWKINNYLFWLDTSGQPNYDVRNLRDKVNAEYIRQSEIKTDMQYYYKMQAERRHKEKQGRSQHKCYPWRDDTRYIQRARAAYAMEAEEEYRRFVKAKDKSFKSIWPDEEFGGYHSTGWKDNSGNRYRHQWEAKERRNYEKIKRNKDITMFSGKKRESPKRRKTKEELLEELDMLRKEFEC